MTGTILVTSLLAVPSFFVNIGIVDHSIRLWDISGRQVGILKGHQGSVNKVKFVPFTNTLVTAGADRVVCIWDCRANTNVKNLTSHIDNVEDVVVSLNVCS